MYSAQDLAALVAIADTGSVRGAAAALGRTQPAVTQAIRRLEAAVGFALLDRSGYRARLTERGETFVKRARTTVAQARGLRTLASLLARGIEPRLRLAVHGAIPTEAWVALARDLPQHFPDTSVEVEAGEGAAPLRRFMAGDAHLALLLDPFPERYASTVERRPLGEIEYVNVVRADRLGDLADGLQEIPQVLAADFDDLTTSFALDEGQRYWRVSDHHMKAAAIAAGIGWGYVPRSMVEAELRDGVFRTVSRLGIHERGARAFALYRKRDQPLGPVASFIWDAAERL